MQIKYELSKFEMYICNFMYHMKMKKEYFKEVTLDNVKVCKTVIPAVTVHIPQGNTRDINKRRLFGFKYNFTYWILSVCRKHIVS